MFIGSDSSAVCREFIIFKFEGRRKSVKTTIMITRLSAAVALALTVGCSTTNKQSGSAADLDRRAAALDTREAELHRLEASLKGGQSSADTITVSGANFDASDLLPPSAAAGECYARVWVPDEYKTVSEQVVATEASERIEIIPAEYQWATETIEVSAASSEITTTPAVYGTESESILVSDAITSWKRSLDKNAAVASEGLLAYAKAHGADIGTASPGSCFHEHTIPATYSTQDEQVLVSEASETVTVVPATYRMVEKTITISEASTKIIQVPATYKTVTEQVMIKPAHTTWKKGTGPIQRIDQSTGEIMCLVEVPAVYATVSKEVIDTAATTKTIEIPAETKTVMVRVEESAASETRNAVPAQYETVSKRVKTSDHDVVWHEIHNLDHPAATRTGQQVCLTEEPAVYKTVSRRVVKTPASSETVVIPAQTETVKVQKLVSEASENRIEIPATYKTVAHQELVSDGFMQWRSILCETNTTPGRITRIQQALADKGYSPGPIDGVVGAQTILAMNEFQKAENLPVDKYLNVETVKALGVTVR